MRAQALAIPITVPVHSSCSNTTNIRFYSHYVTAMFTATVLLLLQLLLSLLLVLDLLWLCDSFYKSRGNKISDSRQYCSIYWRRHKSNSADVYATAVAVAVTVTVTVPAKRFFSHYASAVWQLPLVLYTAITAAFFVLVHPTAKIERRCRGTNRWWQLGDHRDVDNCRCLRQECSRPSSIVISRTIGSRHLTSKCGLSQIWGRNFETGMNVDKKTRLTQFYTNFCVCSDVGVAVRMTEKCDDAQRGESDAALRRDWPQTAEDIVNCGMLWSRAAWTRRYTTHNAESCS